MKHRGEVEEALKYYVLAVNCASSDPTHLFNLAQAYEYVDNVEKV